MVKVNLAGQELMNFEAVPAGLYRVSVDRAEERQASSGNPNIFWLFKISEVIRLTAVVDDPSIFVNRTIMHGTSLTENSLWNLYRTLIALGADEDELQGGELDIDLEEYIGKECVVTVGIQEYPEGSGTFTNRVNNLRSLSETEVGSLV